MSDPLELRKREVMYAVWTAQGLVDVPGVQRRAEGIELGLKKQERRDVRDDEDRDGYVAEVFPAPGGFALWACAVAPRRPRRRHHKEC